MALRWAWASLVVVVATLVVVREWGRVADGLAGLSWPLLVAGTGATAVAKLLLGENARVAAQRHGIELSRWTAVRLYNLSQLGKYVPGSVWQFVGRAVAYRDRGARLRDVRDALLTESLWVVGGATAAGLIFGGTSVVPVVADGLGRTTMIWLAAGVAAVLLVAVALTAWKRRAVTAYLRAAVPTPRAVTVAAGVWLLLGTGFWCFSRSAGVDLGWPYSVGLFSAAYAVGFAVLFAPAGLGVRDAIVVAGLLPFTGTETGVLVAVVARLAYLGVELVLVAVGEAGYRISGLGLRLRRSDGLDG